MKKLLIDVDEVICDPGFRAVINMYLHTNYEMDDFTEYYIDDVIGDKDRIKDFYDNFYLNYNTFDYATLLPDAYDTLKKLNEKYEIYLYSSVINPFCVEKSGHLYADKYNYLIKELPFLDPFKFIFTSSKNLVKADIQIDDRMENLQGESSLKILFTAYHNKNISDETLKENGIIRAGSSWKNAWKDIGKILLND